MSERVAAAGRTSQADHKPGLIAVDGSAASGKSTVGRRLAERLGYRFLDTGVMYRAITWAALDRNVDVHDADALTDLASNIDMRVDLPDAGTAAHARIIIDGRDVTNDLRSPAVDENVSFVSRVPGVRDALVRRQRNIADKGHIVMAGRDIGTVVLPNAELKVYLDASPEERARRRHAEFVRSGREASEAAVLEDLRRRDQLDSERAVSPQRPADDAVIINTDDINPDEVLEQVLKLARR